MRTNDDIRPTRVVYKAVLIPEAMPSIASCNVLKPVTSIAEKVVPSMRMNPITVPTIPKVRHDSAMNHSVSRGFNFRPLWIQK